MRFNKKTLPNGLRIITVPMKDNPTVTVLVMVEAGSKYETKNINGLSHFLEHMCFKGTEKRPTALDISYELDALGAQSGAFTGHEYTGYYAKAASKHFEKLLDIISDIYLDSTFPEQEIEKEKGVIIDEINMYEDMPAQKVDEILLKLLYGNQPAGWSIGGEKERIKKIERKDFLNYKKKHYVAKGSIILISGNVDSRAVKKVKEQFAAIPGEKKYQKKKVKELQRAPAILLKYKKTDQTHLRIAFRGFPARYREMPTVNLLSGVLGRGMSSRLFKRIRDEMGVGYYVGARNNIFTDHGFVVASAGVMNTRAAEVVKAILEECRRLKEELVPPRELKKSKEYLIGNMFLSLENSDDLAFFYGMQEILKKEILKPKEVARKIKAVTAADIKRVARNIFKNEKLNLALIGPFRDKRAFSRVLKF